jgi:hypothetical protein
VIAAGDCLDLPDVTSARSLLRRAGLYVRWLWGVVWFIASVWPLRLAAYHYWAAGSPPTPNPEWHEAWGNVFFAGSLACWSIAGLGIWFMRPTRDSADRVPVGGGLAFSLFMALGVMTVAVWAVPGAGRLILLAPVVLGAAWAVARLRRAGSRG